MNHYPPVISALVTVLLTLILTLSKHGTIQDIPNERSLHDTPVPRTGGIALMAGIMAGWVLLFKFWAWWIVIPMLALFVLSLMDDVRGLQPKTRLIGHFIAALVVLIGSGISWIWMLPVLLFIVWMTNLYNFMDGADGLAGGMAFFGFAAYGIAAAAAMPVLAAACFVIAAAAAGFLIFNFPPARVFLGDAGSIPLGFLAGAFGLLGWSGGVWPLWFPVLVFSPFIVDATLTLLRRALRRERVWQAHREHYYQRLVRMGWGHRRTVLAEYGLMLAAGASALMLLPLATQFQYPGLLAWAAVYAGLALAADRAWAAAQEP